MPDLSLKERKRIAIRRDLTAVALELFLRDGYENTTVDQIAAGAGMSRRTFFRYYNAKDDVIVGKWDLIGLDMITALEERPQDEPIWDSLRGMYDVVIQHYADPQRREQSLAVDSIVAATPALRHSYLARRDLFEGIVTDLLVKERGGDWLVVRAVVGAVTACVEAARDETLQTKPAMLGPAIDRALAAVRDA
ncbi:TetR family transcriptional regulator [Flexivirga meconopsidis]|uniref:TetR family transcriptional regulator n=1 Tax=Flexivirga meconopsidis TaxID=2977121 RepID=UPI00223ECA32